MSGNTCPGSHGPGGSAELSTVSSQEFEEVHNELTVSTDSLASPWAAEFDSTA